MPGAKSNQGFPGGEAAAGGVIPGHGSALELVTASPAVLQADLFAVVEEGSARQGEQNGGSAPQLRRIVAELGGDPLLVVVGEEGRIDDPRRIELGHLLELGGDAGRLAVADRLDDRLGEREVEAHRQLVPLPHRRRRAVVGGDLRGLGPVLPHQHGLRLGLAHARGVLPKIVVGLGLVVLQIPRAVGEEVAGGIEAETVDAAAEPVGGQALHLLRTSGLLKLRSGMPLQKMP